MNIEEFEKLITDQINCFCVARYGSIGSRYIIVLAPMNNHIVELGQCHHDVFRFGYATQKQLIEFGEECEKFRIGGRKTMPSWYQRENLNWEF